MSRPICFVLGVLLLAMLACRFEEPGSGRVIKRAGEPDVSEVAEEDTEMNKAMEQARATVGEFIARLGSPPAGQTYLSLKARFEDRGEVEHIWLSHVQYVDGEFAGTVANMPVGIRNVALGDRVRIPLSRVSDWMAIEDGRLVGGYTVRVLRGRMSPDERKAFDESAGIEAD